MGRRAGVIALGVAAIIVLIGVAAAVWWFQRDGAPAVDLGSAVAQIELAESTAEDSSRAASAAQDSDAEDAVTAMTSPDSTTESVDVLDGVWTVQVADSVIDLLDQPAVSFAGYRVDEVLAGGIGENTAVGRTADVSGSIEVIGNTLVAATVEVAMSTLRTDDSHRDSHARESLGTTEFPTATFILVEPWDLPAGMAEGQAFSGSAVGDLTIKGVTNRATFDLQAQLVGNSIVAVGSSAVVFSDYGVTEPSSIAVISVQDHGIMEFQLIFTR